MRAEEVARVGVEERGAVEQDVAQPEPVRARLLGQREDVADRLGCGSARAPAGAAVAPARAAAARSAGRRRVTRRSYHARAPRGAARRPPLASRRGSAAARRGERLANARDHPAPAGALGAGRDGPRRGRPRSSRRTSAAVVRHVVQDGVGADILFAAGTTGEWDRLANPLRQQVIRVCAEEVAKQNAALAPGRASRSRPGRASRRHTPEETLENLRFAARRRRRRRGARAALDPRRCATRCASWRATSPTSSTRCPRRIPVYLYDNADIAADPRVPHIRTRQVKALSRLDFVRGIKVSAPRKVMGNYTKAARQLPRPRRVRDLRRRRAARSSRSSARARAALGALAEHWQRWRLRGALPDRRRRRARERAAARVGARLAGVPRGRRRAHGRACARVLEAFRDGTRAVRRQARRRVPEARAAPRSGVISSDAVARRARRALARPDAERFDEVWDARARARARAPRARPGVTRRRARRSAR